MTLQALGTLISYTPQYISEAERAKTPSVPRFVEACDAALKADGALLALLHAAMHERDRERQERAAARRAARALASLPCGAHSDAGDDVEPTNRRGLIGAGAAAALGASVAAEPAAARQIDPELPVHLTQLLGVLARHDAAFGPRNVLSVVHRELRSIAAHRKVARGELRRELLRTEARWAQFASWLSGDSGDSAGRSALANRALRLALEGADPDLAAYVLMRQSHWADDAPSATALAQAGRRIATSDGVHALCALKEARGHALGGDALACERALGGSF